MKAVILAAGIGSRLQPITYNNPKCLTKIYGTSLLERQIQSLESNAVTDVYIVTGYRMDAINSLQLNRKYKKIKIHLVENKNYEMTNNMYSLYLVSKYLKGEAFILCNGDIIFENSIVKELIQSEFDDLVAVEQGLFLEESMKIQLNEQNLIIDISKNIGETHSFGCSADLYKFSKLSSEILFTEIEKIIEDEKNLKDWTEVALQRLFRQKRLFMKPHLINGHKWVEIDNYEDLEIADFLFSDLEINQNTICFIDIDGTLFSGNKLIEGSDKFISYLQESKIEFYLLSNNSSYSKLSLSQKLSGMGIKVTEDQIILSTDGLIEYLQQEKITNTYIVGTPEMKEMFELIGIDPESKNPSCVVLGYDTDISYRKIVQASYFINKGVPLLATHCDVNCPTPEGPIPDIGSFLKMFEVALNQKPEKVFGKPNSEMIKHKINKFNHSSINSVVIGDRVYTDMVLAKNCNIGFICVLSGETKREQIEDLESYPDLIVNKAYEIIKKIKIKDPQKVVD